MNVKINLNGSDFMFIVLIRAIILYFIVVFIMRIMGKRQIGQLQPFELVIALMVSELAAMPMQNTSIPLFHGIIPIITLLVLQVLILSLQLKSETARIIFCGKPFLLLLYELLQWDANQLLIHPLSYYIKIHPQYAPINAY